MKARTALGMIGISNLLFGIHFLLWKFGYTPRTYASIDPFTGYLAMWFLLFCALALVEAIAIVMGYRKGDRRAAFLALSAWILQLGIIFYQYWLVNGV